jgi:hypothetical protein
MTVVAFTPTLSQPPAPRELTGRALAQFARHHGPLAVVALVDNLTTGDVVPVRLTFRQALRVADVSAQRYRALRKLAES